MTLQQQGDDEWAEDRFESLRLTILYIYDSDCPSLREDLRARIPELADGPVVAQPDNPWRISGSRPWAFIMIKSERSPH